MLLSMAPSGVYFEIIKIKGNDAMKNRLANMGFVEGTIVRIVSEWCGNLIVYIKGTKYALDKSLANRMIVQEVKGDAIHEIK